MELQLQHFVEDCNMDQLEKVEHDLTVEDCEHFDEIGWKYYREEDLTEYLLPSLGERVCFGYRDDLVIDIKGKRYKFQLHDNELGEAYEPDGKSLSLTPTDEPASVGVPDDGNWRAAHYYHFFGQPRWVQGAHYPAYKGKPCYHLVTVENGWGDCGNWNILISLDENDVPDAAFFEASCC